MEQFYKTETYSNEAFNEEIVTPPYNPDYDDSVPIVREETDFVLPPLTEAEIRDAVIQYASENCCYGQRFAKHTLIDKILTISTFHYVFETFGEQRGSHTTHVPYVGQVIDGPENGPPPLPWDIFATPAEHFKDSQSLIEIPHTAYVKPCHTCVGNGRVRCDSCYGRGGRRCLTCSGTGRRSSGSSGRRSCSSCGGSGHKRCISCSGTGQVKCSTCSGEGRLKCYRELVVTWKTHREHFITETTEMPKEKVLKATGKIIFQEQASRVPPVTHVPDPDVNMASNDLVQKHRTAFPTELILQQRHSLRVVPVTRAEYSWKGKQGVFFVYGFENKVYFEKYPQNCCWGCTIL